MTIKTRRAALLEAYEKTRGDGPKQTIAELISEIGEDAAKMAVAEIVTGVGPWDGRISRSSRNWAAGICAESQSDQERVGVYYSFTPHPAHVENLVSAMRIMEKSAAAESVQAGGMEDK